MILLGIQSPELNVVTVSNNTLASNYQNIIMNALYHPENPNKIYFLKMITCIGNLKYSTELALMTVLNQLPAFENILHNDPKDHPMGRSGRWMTLAPGGLDYTQICSTEYAISYVYYEAFVTTSNLMQQNDVSKLKRLAQLALAEPCYLKLLSDICYIGGIISNPRSIKPISLKSFVCNAPPLGEITPRNPIQLQVESFK